MRDLAPALRYDVGLYLWRESIAERTAVGVFLRLGRATWLMDEERRPLQEFTDDEIRHGDRLRACARAYLRERPAAAGPMPLDMARQPEHLALALVTLTERMTLPGFRAMVIFHERITQDAPAAALYRDLAREEEPHIAWGRQVCARLRHEDPVRHADIVAMLRAKLVSREYKRTAGDRHWMIPRSPQWSAQT